MNTKVDMSFSVDIEDVYSELKYKDQQEFMVINVVRYSVISLQVPRMIFLF